MFFSKCAQVLFQSYSCNFYNFKWIAMIVLQIWLYFDFFLLNLLLFWFRLVLCLDLVFTATLALLQFSNHHLLFKHLNNLQKNYYTSSCEIIKRNFFFHSSVKHFDVILSSKGTLWLDSAFIILVLWCQHNFMPSM